MISVLVARYLLQLQSEACGLPLYRREIQGRPIKTGAFYEEADNDEVEDLYELLTFVKQKHPDIEGKFSFRRMVFFWRGRDCIS